MPGYDVRAVLDQDATLTAGLTIGPDGQHAVLLVGSERLHPGQAEELARWADALSDAAKVARGMAEQLVEQFIPQERATAKPKPARRSRPDTSRAT